MWKLYNNPCSNLSMSPQPSLVISISSRKNIEHTTLISAYILCQRYHHFSHSEKMTIRQKKICNIIYWVSCPILSTLYKYVFLENINPERYVLLLFQCGCSWSFLSQVSTFVCNPLSASTGGIHDLFLTNRQKWRELQVKLMSSVDIKLKGRIG